jgi:UDP-glucuronate 4-epimerase
MWAWVSTEISTLACDEAKGSGERRALVTGCAGFLGSHLIKRLLADGWEVVGVDCFTPFYARARKWGNLSSLLDEPGFRLVELDLAADELGGLLDGVDHVYHLAGQPGVRGSFGPGFEHHVRNNIQATQRLLEAAATHPLSAFVYASSSSVYGDCSRLPAREEVELRPISPYGMTKVATEQLASLYSRARGVPAVGLRYFTVYGPRQRPDMAFARFISSAVAGKPLRVFGDGLQAREFTYVDDAIEATVIAARRGAPGGVYNIGGGMPVKLLDVVRLLEILLERRLAVEHLPAVSGDARRTHADWSLARAELGFSPVTRFADGFAAQLEWMLADSVEAVAA